MHVGQCLRGSCDTLWHYTEIATGCVAYPSVIIINLFIDFFVQICQSHGMGFIRPSLYRTSITENNCSEQIFQINKAVIVVKECKQLWISKTEYKD